jgi:hypothetical protein
MAAHYLSTVVDPANALFGSVPLIRFSKRLWLCKGR